MDAPPEQNPSGYLQILTSFYSKYIRNQLLASFILSGKFLGIFSNLYRQVLPNKRRLGLPLPLPSNSIDSSVFITDNSIVYDVLEDIMGHVFANLHDIQKNLQFWQSRAEGSAAQKAYFMILERGPVAFVHGVYKFIQDFIAESTATQNLCKSASAHMSERIVVLTTLRYALATFLAQIYVEVDKCGEELVNNPDNAFPPLLVIINGLFHDLEASIGHLHAMRPTDSSVEGSYSLPLMFERLPEINQEGSQWTGCELTDAINLVYKNLQKLNSYLSLMVAKHRKPKKVTLHWIRYACSGIGLSVCSVWLLRHSSLMGSSDIDNWIHEGKEATVSFFNDHVEQPLLSIRDELFDTFRKRHKGVMESEEVQLTYDSLRRMLRHFIQQTTHKNLPADASDQEMLTIVMTRYERELEHPIHNLLGGELARAILIQVQKLKLDIETAMLELDQILKANEINFAVMAALPAFVLFFGMSMLVRTWLKQDSRAEGRGRIARLQRRLFVVEVEKRIMQYQSCIDQGQEKDAQCMFGLMIYSLDRLFQAVERHATETGEWQYLRQDIIDLGKPGLQTTYKLAVTARLIHVYDCLLPSLRRQ